MKQVLRTECPNEGYDYLTVFGGLVRVFPGGHKYWLFQAEGRQYVARIRSGIEFKYSVKILTPMPNGETHTVWAEGRTRREAFKELRSLLALPILRK